MFKINEGKKDRLARIIIAIVLFALAWYFASGILQTILYVLAVISLVTAITGFCGLYKLLGINTKEVKKDNGQENSDI